MSFLTFSIFILSGRDIKSRWKSYTFSRHWTSTWRKYPSWLSSLWFFIKSSLNWEVFLIHLKLFTGSFCDISQPFKLFIPNIGDLTILYFYNNLSLQKKWSFPLRTSAVNVTKSPVSCGFGHIFWRNP